VEWLYLAGDTPETELAGWLAAALPHCSWSCHLVVAANDHGGRLLDTVVDFLVRERLAVVHLHQAAASSLPGSPQVERLMAAAERFQTEAYRERTGARLVSLPILEIPSGADPRPALAAAADLAARLAKPGLLLRDPPTDETVSAAAALGFRLFLGSDTDSVMGVLTENHVLDSTIDRVEDGGRVLDPCRAHLVVAGGRVYDCARKWQLAESRGGIGDARPPGWAPDTSLCAGCIADAVTALGPSLAANLRRTDGRELALLLSAALVDRGDHGPAAEVARTAVELSTSDGQVSDALIQTGLCLLAAGRLDDADRALAEAAGRGAQPGLIAYHRARVQVAWRDDIEALDRYAEALELGTDAVATPDLHFEIALSHIRLEEWADARAHLENAGGPSAEISFNLGVCWVNDGRADRAIRHFDRAVELRPSPADLGRVVFYRGYCLKELERYEEAVDDLRRSVELEPGEVAHHNLLGFCLFKLGRHADAVASFERAVAVDPGSAIDWANLGVNLERLGDSGRAADMYRKALGMDGGIGFAREGLERLGG
jgi:tetratricopeptide (TPR) repeat protein